jgi:2-polyprenyl-6-methoxyphenol hydroxylase-like FAD-dependent oxidoreductase
MKILIVGAGIGGLTLANFLKESSIEFDIIDKAKDWSALGYSIGLWNNGRNILEKLGLSDVFDKHGNRARYYQICDGKGKVLRRYDLSEFYSEYALAYTHISRDLLHTILLERLGKEKISMGTTIDTLNLEKYDLIVGADGIHSKVREKYFGTAFEKFDNWRVWYAWIDAKFKQNNTVTEYIEAGEFIGVFDVGDKALAVLIAPAEHSVWDDVKGRVQRLKGTFKDEALFSDVIGNLKDEDIVPTDLSHVEMKDYVCDKAVLLGDAAHGFEPHAGLGASMAMEDGYVLAGELMKVTSEYPLTKALRKYQTVRRKRVRLARKLTNRMRAWAFIKSKLLRQIVNFFVPYIPQSFFTKTYHELLREEI